MKQIYITATEARRTFFELLEKVKKSEQPINISIKGIPEAVLVSKEHYDGLIATLETYEDPELMAAIEEGKRNFANGEYVTWEELKKELASEEAKEYMIADKGKKDYVSHPHRKKSTKKL